MAKLLSWVIAGGSKDVRTVRTVWFLLACLSAVLATVAVAAGDSQWASPDSDDESAEQTGRLSSLLRYSEGQNESPPRVADSAYEFDEDCE